MDKIINLRLMSNPLNWVILFLMIAIAYLGAGHIAQSFNQS